MEGDSVTFAFDMSDIAHAARLLIRCDARGDVYACIPDGHHDGPPYPFTAGD